MVRGPAGFPLHTDHGSLLFGCAAYITAIFDTTSLRHRGSCFKPRQGLTASSLGRLLKLRGLNVTMQKLDPYLNVDPGTMNPFQHGEVFVTDDGTETDLDVATTSGSSTRGCVARPTSPHGRSTPA